MNSIFKLLSEMNQQGRPPENINNPLLNQTYSSLTMASVFKPVPFGNVLTLNRNYLIKKSTMFLNKLNNLQKRLKDKLLVATPQTKSKIETDIKYTDFAYKIHHQYLTKLMFWKSRNMLLMGPQVKQLQEQYSRQLFMLNQDYQRSNLKLNPVNTSNY